MGRFCIVPNCGSTDNQILSHRFPRNNQQAEPWQNALALSNYSVSELQRKYVVCTRHFDLKEYRNPASNSLNTTAVPSLNPNAPRACTDAVHTADADIVESDQMYVDDNDKLYSVDVESIEPEVLNETDDLDDNSNFDLIESSDCLAEGYEEEEEEEEVPLEEEDARPNGDKCHELNAAGKCHEHEVMMDYLERGGGVGGYRDKLTRMTHGELIDEALTARQLIEDLWRRLRLHESVREDIQRSLAKLN